MTARVWTREELDRVHKMRGGWEWVHDSERQWHAMRVGRDGDWHVWVDECDTVCSMWLAGAYDPPADVALAVILASKGLDSYEAMAAAMEQRAEYFDDGARRVNRSGQTRAANLASAQSMRTCAEMLRRGTVQPC